LTGIKLNRLIWRSYAKVIDGLCRPGGFAMKHVVLVALSVGVAFAATGAMAVEEVGDPQAGFDYAHTYCATCHGISAEKSPLPQAPRFRTVADQRGVTATALQVWMQTSHPTMPNIIVAPQDMRNVIAYILSLKGREGSTP
jgi:mono/diheme cytochrome c family protein